MPKIPTYDVWEVETRPLPGVRQNSAASPALFGATAEATAQAARGLGAISDAAAELTLKRKKEEDLLATETAFREMNDATTGYLQSAKQTRLGEQASNLAGDYLKWFDETATSIKSKLANDDQRRAFDTMAFRLRAAGWNDTAEHEVRERNKAIVANAKAIQERAINNGAGRLSDDVAQSDKDTGLNAVNLILAREGLLNDPEAASAARREYTSAFHSARILALLEADPKRAEGYFDKWYAAGEVNESIAARLRNSIKGTSRLVAIERDVETLTKSGKTYGEINNILREKYEGKDQQDALQLLRAWRSDTAAAEKDSLDEFVREAYTDFIKGGRKMKALSPVKRAELLERDPQTYAAFQEEELRWAKQRAGEGASGSVDGPKYSDAWYGLYQEYLTDKVAFSKKNLLRDPRFMRLTESDKQEIARLQNLKAEEANDIASLDQQLSAAVKGLPAKLHGTFYRATRQAVLDEQRRKGRALTYDEREAVIDRMLIEGEVDPKWWRYDQTKYRFQTYGLPEDAKFTPLTPIKATTLQDVPIDHQNAIRRNWPKNRPPPTPQEIIRQYNKAIEK